MVDNERLRANAREQLGGIFQQKWLMTALACLISSLLVAAISAPSFSIRESGFRLSFSMLNFLIAGSLTFGLCRITVRRVRKEGDVDLGDLFSGFSENYGQSLLLGLLQNLFIALWTLLFIVPGVIKSYSYSMSFYLMQENPDKKWRECLDQSRFMMDGYKGQLFMLDLSFILWYLLGALCLGVGVFFVAAYHQTARANFFMARAAECNPKPPVPPQPTME